ncbi:unnamed protein product [Heligmosomoides polygyrus]|uniref:Transposase n=1 Tax=Heligmosomoides polygyrus TaxID=6339 RepID=A0A183FZM4_HELPZ|nr:unnamed protein product [Heligmosomoides polygyrus]
MLGVPQLTQVRVGIRTSPFRRRSKIRDAVAWPNSLKINRHRVESAGCQENTRTITEVLVGRLDPLEYSGTGQGRMETLLAHARTMR